jgi:hypothetical protein
MPKGPRGEKRPADAIGRAIKIAEIAAGKIEDERDPVTPGFGLPTTKTLRAPAHCAGL